MQQQNIMFVFLQVQKLVMVTTVKVKNFLRMEVSTTCCVIEILQFYFYIIREAYTESQIHQLILSFHTNPHFPTGAAEKATAETLSTLTFSLENPSEPFV